MTKKIIFGFGLLLTMGMATVMFTACDKDDKDDNDKKEKSILVKNESDLTQTLYADKSQGNNIQITTAGAWSSSIATLRSSGASTTWISTSPDHGDHAGDYTINILLEPNTTGADRTAVITISSDGAEITITVTQRSVTENGEVPGNTIGPNNPNNPNNTLTYDPGVVINGVKWATRNVDAPGTFAATPEAPGMFYQWNRKTGWSATNPMVNSDGGTTWDATTPGGTEWTKANDPSPAGWRVPTRYEIQKLFDTDNVSNEWTTENGIGGWKFTDKTTNASLFLPAADYRYYSDGSPVNAGSYGQYWSSTQLVSGSAYGLHFTSVVAGENGFDRRDGFSVRCVSE